MPQGSLQRTLLVVVFCCASAAASAQPRFGDSTWVAPYPVADSVSVPLDAGPRVAEPDHEPTAEKILRFPFRLVFFPVRLLARGVEGAIDLVDVGEAGDFGFPIGPGLLRPTVNYGSTAGFSLPLLYSIPARGPRRWDLEVAGAWSTRDHRAFAARWQREPFDSPWRYGLEGSYIYRPNLEFYGVGNFSRLEDRSIYLDESGRALAAVRLGQTLRQQLRLQSGVSIAGSRRGYNGSPAAADRFTEQEVPFLEDATELAFVTLGGDFARVDNEREPSVGVHLSATGTRYFPLGEDEIKYWEFRTAGRLYVPVFAPRRVIAIQAEHLHVHPDAGSEPVPFYRLPASVDLLRFAAYPNGRFVDRHLVLARAEYRWWIGPYTMAIGFAEIGEVASRYERLRIADVHESYGGGLRFASNPYTSVRLEIATGAEGTEFNVRFGGVF